MSAKRWALLVFMAMTLRGIFFVEDLTVTKVEHGIVTMESSAGDTYTIEEAEAWQVGDRAECIIFGRGTKDKADDVIMEARYIWRIRK